MTATAALALLLAGCASPGPNAQLVEARNVYAAASTNPQVAANAPLELQQAREALQRAEAAERSDAGRDEVASLAYVATRESQAAMEVASAKQAQQTLATGDIRRSNAQLQRANAELQRELDALEARRTARGYVMTLGDVLFATDQANLTSGAEERLSRLASFLRQHPERTVRVEGYTDNTGAPGYNLQLSERRADAVRNELLAHGVSPDRVVTVGRGEAQPVASNATQSGRQANRRVEIVISDPGGGAVAETR
ncbi:MAG TPA: OmpA family protein [Azospirillum sp.]|nr:OmpA family protein [Azospirillum sp.]